MKRHNPLSFLLALALPLAAVAVSGPALAQGAPATARAAATRVSIDGRFQRYILNPRGHVMGLLLQDGTVVFLPRRAARGAAISLKPYDAIHVDGGAMKTPSGTVIMRPVVRQNGTVLVDASKHRARGQHGERGKRGERARHGREHEGAALAPVTAVGRVQAIVSTPRGHVLALLLDDGTSATGFGLDGVPLRIGDRVAVSGKGGAYAQGKALRIETITLPSGETRALPKAPAHDGQRRRHGAAPKPV